MPESLHTRAFRWLMNFWPCYRGTGGRISYIARDWSEVRVRLPLNWRTRNYVGTIFGGSLYGAADPIYMLMLIKRLGPDFVVWDKSATIRFRKPGRCKLTAHFRIEDFEVEEIKRLLEDEPKVDRTYSADLVDNQGLIYAEIQKVIHIARLQAT